MATGFRGDPPIALALLTCDSVAVAVPPFQKTSVLGLYDHVYALAVPTQHFMTVFALLLDVLEPVRLGVRMTAPTDALGATGQLIGAVEMQLPPDIAAPSQAFFSTQVTFPEYGRYEIHLYGNDTYLAHKPLFVRQFPMQPNPQPPA